MYTGILLAMSELQIFFTLLSALALGVRASWVWQIRGCKKVQPWRATAGAVAAGVVLLNALWFICVACRGEIGGFGTHYMTTRMVGWYFLASVLTTMSVWLLKGESRWEAFLASFLTTALWFGAGIVA